MGDSKEAVGLARAVLQREDVGDARFVLAQALSVAGEDAEALAELQAAIPYFDSEPARQDEIFAAARACAARFPAEPHIAALVERDIAAAMGRRGVLRLDT